MFVWDLAKYKFTRKDRVGNRGGGVIFYVREHLKCKQMEWVCEHNLECIGLKIALSPHMSIMLIGMYRPPSASNAFYAELQALHKECDMKNEVILLGDLNINWLDKSIRKQLKSLLTNFNFTQLIKGPTRLTTSSETCIDLVFSNKCERIVRNRFSCTKKTISEQMRVPRREIPNLIRALNNINWNNYLTHNHVIDNCNVLWLLSMRQCLHLLEKSNQNHQKSPPVVEWNHTDITEKTRSCS